MTNATEQIAKKAWPFAHVWRENGLSGQLKTEPTTLARFFKMADEQANPPTAADLASHHETGRLPNAPPCLRCGLSVFRDVQDAVHQQRLIPKLGRWIARGTLSAEHGQTKQTPGQQPTHTTWWAYEGINRAALFTVVGEEG